MGAVLARRIRRHAATKCRTHRFVIVCYCHSLRRILPGRRLTPGHAALDRLLPAAAIDQVDEGTRPFNARFRRRARGGIDPPSQTRSERRIRWATWQRGRGSRDHDVASRTSSRRGRCALCWTRARPFPRLVAISMSPSRRCRSWITISKQDSQRQFSRVRPLGSDGRVHRPHTVDPLSVHHVDSADDDELSLMNEDVSRYQAVQPQEGIPALRFAQCLLEQPTQCCTQHWRRRRARRCLSQIIAERRCETVPGSAIGARVHPSSSQRSRVQRPDASASRCNARLDGS
jgi:hypothetical protein